ncbi:MAG: hypothetical protein V4525_02315 [Pseudomonadota bacterium]
MRITSVLDYLQWHKDHCTAQMFRGQGDIRWSLWPVRYADCLKEDYEGILQIEQHLVK